MFTASWMKRYASEDESKTSEIPFKLSPLQEEKLLNFFKYYLDGDCDGFVFEHDFHQFAEVPIHTKLDLNNLWHFIWDS